MEGVVSEHGEEAVAAAIECRVGRARPGGGRAAFRLVDVKKPGGAAVVCHAVPGGAQGLPVKTGGESPSLAQGLGAPFVRVCGALAACAL